MSGVLVSFFISLVGTWILTQAGVTLRLVDHPVDRSSHSVPVPKGGGIGILAAFLWTAWAFHAPFSIWIPAAIVSLLGFLGDRIPLSPIFRLAVQCIAASVSVRGIGVEMWAFLPAVVFLVGTTNFFNFMDGIDGIAGLIGVVSFSLIAGFALKESTWYPIGAISVCLIAACLGFLPLNFPRARVFMGDVGSLLLGYLFACSVLYLSATPGQFICLSSFLFVFYVDELSTMVLRIRIGENLLAAHRRHYYQLLANEKGISHWRIATGYALAQSLVGILAWVALDFGAFVLTLLLLIVASAFVVHSLALRRQLGTLNR